MVTEKTHSASKLCLFTVVLDFLFSASADKSLEADGMGMPRMDTRGTRHSSEGTLQFSKVPESTPGRFSVSLPCIILAGIICLHIPLQLWQSALSSTTDQSETQIQHASTVWEVVVQKVDVPYVLQHLLAMAYFPREIFYSWCPKNGKSAVMFSEGEAEALRVSATYFSPLDRDWKLAQI